MKKINININLGMLIIIGVLVLVLIGGGLKLFSNKVNNLKDDLQTEINLKDALLDTVSNYQNQKNEWVAEKLTIQASIDDLKKDKVNLTNSQKELLSRINSVEKEKNKLKKEKEVIAAALIETQQIVDSLIHEGKTVVDTTAKKITFTDSYEKTIDNVKYSLNYDFTVGNVLPFDDLKKPTLLINSLSFPNKQFIDFHWNKDKRKDYPIAFSISNSNGFYQTTNIESYAIPNLKKELVNPTGWQKFTSFFDRNSQKVIYIGIGGVLGVGTYIILTK
jgi:hypothetical protein